MNPNGKDPYKTLGVSETASQADIKRSYRDLAKKYHPDRSGADKRSENRFKEITAAYEVLGDADKRAKYDSMRRGGFPPGMDGQQFDFGDLFSQFFGGGRATYQSYPQGGRSPFGGGGFSDPFGAPPQQRRQRAAKPKPTEKKVKAIDGSTLLQKGTNTYGDANLSLEQALLGANIEVPTLYGRASVKIPAGTNSGVKLRLRGQGAKQRGSAGDHFVTVQIKIPKKLSSESKKQLKAFLKTLPENS